MDKYQNLLEKHPTVEEKAKVFNPTTHSEPEKEEIDQNLSKILKGIDPEMDINLMA